MTKSDEELIALARGPQFRGPTCDFAGLNALLDALADRLEGRGGGEIVAWRDAVPPPHWPSKPDYDRHPATAEEWDFQRDPPDESLARSVKRLNFAGDLADPRAPDQMALVFRMDLIRLKHDWLTKSAYFETTKNRLASREGEGEGWREPEGWKLVPVEPTEEMMQAGSDSFWPGDNAPRYLRNDAKKAYAAMLAASPAPPPPVPDTANKEPTP